MSNGYRDDGGKPRYSLVPSDALDGVARVLTWACTSKPNPYPERNWEKGMAWSRCFNSMMRHAWKWWRGQDLDEESGLPHVDHMATNAMMLAAYFRRPDVAMHDDRENLYKRDPRALNNGCAPDLAAAPTKPGGNT